MNEILFYLLLDYVIIFFVRLSCVINTTERGYEL